MWHTLTSYSSLWALTAALFALFAEYLYRTLQGSWASNLVYYLPLQVGVSYCVYRLVSEPGVSLVDAFIVWAVVSTLLRVFVSVVVLHDQVAGGTWAAVILVLLAKLVQTYWR